MKALPAQNLFAIKIQQALPKASSLKYSHSTMDGYMGATAFIIAHEIGHHFFKHTELKTNLLQPYPKLGGFNVNHEHEFSADSFALNLMFAGRSRAVTKEELSSIRKKDSFEYLCGPVIAFITLTYGDSTPYEASDSHPSIRDRYLQMMEQIKQYCTSDEYDALVAIATQTIEGINNLDPPWGDAIWWK